MPRFSQDWLNRHEARQRGKHPATLADQPGASREAQLQKDIAAYCRQKGWIALHGSMAESTARTIGEPDFTILADGGKVMHIECKTSNGKQTSEQLGMQQWMERLGHFYRVVRSMDGFFAAMRERGLA